MLPNSEIWWQVRDELLSLKNSWSCTLLVKWLVGFLLRYCVQKWAGYFLLEVVFRSHSKGSPDDHHGDSLVLFRICFVQGFILWQFCDHLWISFRKWDSRSTSSIVVQNILFVYLMIYLTVGGQRSQKSSIFTTKKIVGVLRLVLCDTWDETVKIVTIYSLRSNYTLLRSNKIELNFFKTSAWKICTHLCCSSTQEDTQCVFVAWSVISKQNLLRP
jgi:hypothetical protein